MMNTTNDDETMMKRHGITCEQKSVYHYKKYNMAIFKMQSILPNLMMNELAGN